MGVQFACGGRIRHLLFEDLEAHGTGLQRSPVRCGAEDRFVLIQNLVREDVDAARKVALRIQDRSAGIVRRKVFVGVPVEIAAVAPAVLISELEETLLVNDPSGNVIGHGDLRLSVTDVGGRIQSCLGGSYRLKEIRPPRALVCIAHLVERGTVAANIAGNAIRQHGMRQGALDEYVPAVIPCGTAQLGGFHIEGRGWRDLDLRFRRRRRLGRPTLYLRAAAAAGAGTKKCGNPDKNNSSIHAGTTARLGGDSSE